MNFRVKYEENNKSPLRSNIAVIYLTLIKLEYGLMHLMSSFTSFVH